MRTIKIMIEELDNRHMQMDIDYGKLEDGTQAEHASVEEVRMFLDAHSRYKSAIVGHGATMEESRVSIKTYMDILKSGGAI